MFAGSISGPNFRGVPQGLDLPASAAFGAIDHVNALAVVLLIAIDAPK
jgi:hypothetical protein